MAAKPNDIQHHLDAMNAAWRLYHLLENRWCEPEAGQPHSDSMSILGAIYKENLAWLEAHGIPEQSLIPSSDKLTWSIDDATMAVALSSG